MAKKATKKKATKKKAAKKAAPKKPKAPKPEEPTEAEVLSDYLLSEKVTPSTRTVIMKYKKKLDKSYHPRTIEEVEACLKLFKECPFLTIASMEGHCKIWDEFVKRWDWISERLGKGKIREVRAWVKSIERPYKIGILLKFDKARYE